MRGKEKCELLKDIRRKIAEQYGLTYHPTECTHEGDCRGTCPRCDAELEDVQRQVEEKGINDIEVQRIFSARVDDFSDLEEQGDDHRLEGDAMPPVDPIMLQGMPVPPEGTEIPERTVTPKKKKVFFKECAIASWNFHDPEDFWDELCEGAELVLIREKGNPHDKNAVAVAFAGDYSGDPDDFDFDFIIGYVPRTENELIAQMMDMGWADAFTAEITTVNNYGPYANRLRMTIYIQSKDELEEVPHTFAVHLDDEGYKDIQDELMNKGFSYFRWGGYPVWEHKLPNEGDKVVLIHHEGDDTALYLMRVIATEEARVSFFSPDPDELHRVDDCCPFILTNIIGPLKVATSALRFLEGESVENGYTAVPLSLEAEERLISIITNKTTSYIDENN